MHLGELKTPKNIIQTLNVPPIFTDIEKVELIEAAIIYMDEFIQSVPLMYSKPYFHDTLHTYLFNELMLQVGDVFEYDIEDDINIILNETYKIYFSHGFPRRSYSTTFIRKKPNIKKLTEKIKYIKSKPQPEQRTDAWYLYRNNLITASSAWKALSTQGNINQLIYEKCSPLDLKKNKFSSITSSLHWGQKYEPISTMLYEYRNKTKIEDFGCIKHDTYDFMGASPDGINVASESDLYGRMLEIKNIVSREITGIPKEEYWIQTQLQMEICNLNECDFLETRFIEYEGEEEFLADGTFTLSKENEQKGIIIHFMKNSGPYYEYMPVNLSQEDAQKWIDKIMEKNAELSWISNIYWRLDQYNCILVLRNKLWFAHAIKEFKKVWDIIIKEKISGYEHRAPKKKAKKPEITETKQADGCMISISDLSLNNANLNVDLDVQNQDKKIIIESKKENATTVIHIKTETMEESQQESTEES